MDNTTSDGRKLTVLCYLNGGDWSEADGGALRVHATDGAPKPASVFFSFFLCFVQLFFF